MSADARLVVVAGAGGMAGRPTCGALVESGHRVVALDRVPLDLPGCHCYRADLTDPEAVGDLVARVRDEHGPVDALVHLVGGWRGGSGFTDTTEEDWLFLRGNLVDSLRHLTLALHDDLVASEAGRAVIVSATAAAAPTAGNAAYASLKAAAEAWLMALADSFRRHQSGRKDADVPQTSAAAALVVKALVDDAMREASPERTFPGFTDTGALARAVLDVLDGDAAQLNGTRVPLHARS